MLSISAFCLFPEVVSYLPRLFALVLSVLCLAPLMLAPDWLLGSWLAICYGTFAFEFRRRQRQQGAWTHLD
jgi:hypothetical protein